MPLDSSKPTGTTLAYELASLQREDRQQINALWAAIASGGWASAFTAVGLGVNPASLECGANGALGDVPVEVVRISGTIASHVQSITKGRAGMIKIFVANDANVTFDHSSLHMVLNGDQNLPMQQHDVLALLNLEGDPEAGNNGKWIEVFRNLRA